jgi:hypothetical protein
VRVRAFKLEHIIITILLLEKEERKLEDKKKQHLPCGIEFISCWRKCTHKNYFLKEG